MRHRKCASASYYFWRFHILALGSSCVVTPLLLQSLVHGMNADVKAGRPEGAAYAWHGTRACAMGAAGGVAFRLSPSATLAATASDHSCLCINRLMNDACVATGPMNAAGRQPRHARCACRSGRPRLRCARGQTERAGRPRAQAGRT